MKNKLISIILPVYNGQDFLREALLSIKNQTYNNFEVIIINDASTDNTLSIAKEFCDLDARFNLFTNSSNLKLPKSLNKGHSLAKGEYITWTSHDNILKPDFLEVLKDQIFTQDVDLVYSNFDIISSDGSLKRKHTTKKPEHLLFGNVVGASFLYKKTLFDNIGGYNEDLFLAEDYDFWLRACKNHKLSHVKENLYKYRLHENSLTQNISKKKEFNTKHKNAVRKMFRNLFEELQIEIDYSEVFFELYFKNISLNLVQKLIAFKNNGLHFFKFDEVEFKNVVYGNIRNYLFNRNISRTDLALILFSNPDLLSIKYNRNKSIKLLLKIIT